MSEEFFDAAQITSNYTTSLLTQCTYIESQLKDSGMDDKFLKLISIQAAYNSFKHLVSEVNDLESQKNILRVFEFDAKNLVFPISPNVDSVGHA